MASLCRKGISCNLIFLHKKKNLNDHDIDVVFKSFVLIDDTLLLSCYMMSTKRNRHLVSTSFYKTCDVYMGVCNDLLLRMCHPRTSFHDLVMFLLE